MHARGTHRPEPALCVLASGSAGNCSVLDTGRGPRPLLLLDAGLSPRRTAAELDAVGRSIAQVGAVVLTHADHDHLYASWARALPASVNLWAHEAHAGERALAPHAKAGRLRTYADACFQPLEGVRAHSALAPHDDTGVATLRLAMAAGRTERTLSYLTDLGAADAALTRFHAHADVLAIESNYCPAMQRRSDRPAFLKSRITDGRGHLSNEQCLRATEAIAPSQHAVFLHLSRQCNHPQLVADLHAGADYARTIATQDGPTRWVSLSPCAPPPIAHAACAAHLHAGARGP